MSGIGGSENGINGGEAGLDSFDSFDFFDEQLALATETAEGSSGETQASQPGIAKSIQQIRCDGLEHCLYLDLECVPDDDRAHLFGISDIAPLPEPTPYEGMLAIDAMLKLSIPEIQKRVCGMNPADQYLYDLAAAESKQAKPRAGVQAAIDKVFSMRAEHAEAIPRQRKEMACNPAMCRMVSAAWAVGDSPIECEVVGEWSDRNERDILETLWDLIRDCKPIVTWNGNSYDLRVIFMRSIILGVQPTRIINTAKYNSRDSLDLQDVFWNYQIPQKGRGMKWAAKVLGIEIPAGDCDGSQVEGLWFNGQHEELAGYNRSDVHILRELHRKMIGTFCVA